MLNQFGTIKLVHLETDDFQKREKSMEHTVELGHIEYSRQIEIGSEIAGVRFIRTFIKANEKQFDMARFRYIPCSKKPSSTSLSHIS